MASPEPPAPSLLSRFQGCLLGLATGDALGAPVEGYTREEIRRQYGTVTEMLGGGWLKLAPGAYTDDTEMMLALARSIVGWGGFAAEDVARHFLKWFDSNPRDIGRTTYVALSELKRGVLWREAGEKAHRLLGGFSAGNGSIMRCAPIGLLHFQRPDKLMEHSLESSLITHWDPRACWATVAVNQALVLLLSGRREGLLAGMLCGVEQEQVREAVLGVERVEEKKLTPTGFVLHTIQCALYCFRNTVSLEQALIQAVNLGGDADTVGAVTGALSGAYYGLEGIPARWRDQLRSQEEILSLAQSLYQLAAKG